MSDIETNRNKGGYGLVERIKFCFVDKFNITYPPEKVVCNLCNKVVKFKNMAEHRRYCPPADWRIPTEGDV